MISLSVSAVDGEADLYDKTAEELQQDIVIDENSISGILKHVSGYSGFSSDVSEQSGNYLALNTEITEGATITTEIVGGKHGPVDITDDGFCVYKITDKDEQQIKFTVTKGEETETKVYSLSGLTLNEAD